MADKTDIAQSIAILSAAYPNFKISEHTSEVYYQLLADIPGDLLKAAVLKCCGESGRAFAPSIGEIRGAVAEIRKTIASVPTSYQAWEEVRRAFSDVGSYRTPRFSCPIIEQAVNALGWRNLCLSEDGVSDRARFIQAYEQLAARAEAEDMMLPQVRGYIEANGKQLPAPVAIKFLADKMRK